MRWACWFGMLLHAAYMCGVVCECVRASAVKQPPHCSGVGRVRRLVDWCEVQRPRPPTGPVHVGASWRGFPLGCPSWERPLGCTDAARSPRAHRGACPPLSKSRPALAKMQQRQRCRPRGFGAALGLLRDGRQERNQKRLRLCLCFCTFIDVVRVLDCSCSSVYACE